MASKMVVVPLQCDVCNKQFSGPVPAEQHYASADHKKKESNIRSASNSGTYCSVCNIKCDTQAVLQNHLQSPKHNEMLQRRSMMQSSSPQLNQNPLVNPGQSPQPSMPRQRCEDDPTDKEYVFSRVSNKGFCYLCNIELTSQSHAQSHIEGNKHKKRSRHLERHSEVSENEFTWAVDPLFISITPKPTQEQLQTPAAAACAYTRHNCNVCSMMFNSQKQKDEHLASEKHINKVMMLQDKQTPLVSETHCNPCGQTFRRTSDRNCHFETDEHRRRMQVYQGQKESTGTSSSLICTVCDVTCTSQQNKEDHMKGKKHLRNVENMRIRGHPNAAVNQQSLNMFSPVSTLTVDPVRQNQPPEAVNRVLTFQTITQEKLSRGQDYGQNLFSNSQQEKIVEKQGQRYQNFSSTTDVNSFRDTAFQGTSAEDSLNVKPIASEAHGTDCTQNTMAVTNSQSDASMPTSLCVKPVSDIGRNLPGENETHNENNVIGETADSMCSLSLNSVLDGTDVNSESDACSSRYTEPYRVVRNDLNTSFPIGRGRGLWQIADKLPWKVQNTDNCENEKVDNPFGEKIEKGQFEYETLRKQTWNETLEQAPDQQTGNTDATPINDLKFSASLTQPPFCSESGDMFRTSADNNMNDLRSESEDSLAKEGIQFGKQLEFQASGKISVESYTTSQPVTNTDAAKTDDYYFNEELGTGRCYICKVNFTSRQHKDQHISGQHHRKVQLAQRELKHLQRRNSDPDDHLICAICSTSFQNSFAKKQHMEGPKHKQKVEEQLGINTSEAYFCDVCKVPCTSLENYQQHLQGAQHRKLSGSLRSPSTSPGLQGVNNPETYVCDVCNVPCSSRGNYEQHLEGAQHQKMVRLLASANSSVRDSVVDYHCNICKVSCSSQGNLEQHLEGAQHKKIAQLLASGNSELKTQGINNDGTYYCDLCKAPCSSRENLEQHLAGAQHKNMVRFSEPVNLSPEFLAAGNSNSLFCDVCKVPCTSLGNYEQHLRGAQHKKMVGSLGLAGLSSGFQAIDQTIWYPCRVCNCSLNTREQLKIHEQSPKHLAKLAKQTSASAGISAIDRTVWFPCEVCSCQLNTREQLLIHEQSPKHLKQLEKQRLLRQHTSGLLRQQNLPKQDQSCFLSASGLQENQTKQDQSCFLSASGLQENQSLQSPFSTISNDFETPLDSFLSEELFPVQFLPPDMASDNSKASSQQQKAASPVELKVTDEVFVMPNRYAIVNTAELVSANNNNNSNNRQDSLESREQYRLSDGGYVIRNRSSVGSSGRGNESDEPESPRMRQSQNTDGDHVNPYAATHPFYCHTCKSPMNTRESYESHLRGKRHMQKVCTEPAPDRSHLPPRDLRPGYLPATKTKPRSYQIELYQRATAMDSLVFLPTGTGKTLVSVMTMVAMLEKHRTKNVLFLVDKVLLVLQQSMYIQKEIGQMLLERYNPDSVSCTEIQTRCLRIAGLCMGQQNTAGVPLWKHDVLVITAGFCQNLLSKGILRWSDFSLVVFDEAHHCEKAHPYNYLLTNYHHRQASQVDRPRILGLTASPAGKSDVPKTLQMLQKLLSNMGDVQMCIVQNPVCIATLNEYQSNAQIQTRCIPMLDQPQGNVFQETFTNELNVYIMYCVLRLLQISNIKYYISFDKEIKPDMQDSLVRLIAGDFVERELDMILSSLMMLENTSPEVVDKVTFSYFQNHTQGMCMARSSLYDGGIFCAWQELNDLNSQQYGFEYAKGFGMPTEALQQLLQTHQDIFFRTSTPVSAPAHTTDNPLDYHAYHLIEELISSADSQDPRRISLVLVKQRSTAYYLSTLLQNSPKMQHAGLKTATVVGHGSSGGMGDGMSVRQQKRVLEEIKQFMYQVVIATSVAEEGVDWPECENVISMYPPTTVTALIQMRGRARRKNSKFIVLCRSPEEEEKLTDIIEREENMITATRLLVQGNQPREDVH